MTRKQFIPIADAISKTKFANDEEKAIFIGRMCHIFEQANPAFNTKLFMKACCFGVK